MVPTVYFRPPEASSIDEIREILSTRRIKQSRSFVKYTNGIPLVGVHSFSLESGLFAQNVEVVCLNGDGNMG